MKKKMIWWHVWFDILRFNSFQLDKKLYFFYLYVIWNCHHSLVSPFQLQCSMFFVCFSSFFWPPLTPSSRFLVPRPYCYRHEIMTPSPYGRDIIYGWPLISFAPPYLDILVFRCKLSAGLETPRREEPSELLSGWKAIHNRGENFAAISTFKFDGDCVPKS